MSCEKTVEDGLGLFLFINSAFISVSWNGDTMAGARATISDHEVTWDRKIHDGGIKPNLPGSLRIFPICFQTSTGKK